MGRRSRGRDITGILLLDKPSGLTSNQALQRVKRLFDARKAGHTGSLDPLATGLLPLCFGHATKVSAFLLDADKSYEVTARFGAQTTTGDAQGEVLETTDCLPSNEAVDAAALALTGDIQQVPPMYSALKHKGRRLYALAREGLEVERPPRPVTVYAFERTAVDGSDVSFTVRCSKGTYVRTLVEDLAKFTGSLAHVAALRRTHVGAFDSTGMLGLDQLEEISQLGVEALDARLCPVDSALMRWPAVTLGRETAFYLLNGQAVSTVGAPAAGQVRLYSQKGEFLGLGEVMQDGRVAPRRLFR